MRHEPKVALVGMIMAVIITGRVRSSMKTMAIIFVNAAAERGACSGVTTGQTLGNVPHGAMKRRRRNHGCLTARAWAAFALDLQNMPLSMTWTLRAWRSGCDLHRTSGGNLMLLLSGRGHKNTMLRYHA